MYMYGHGLIYAKLVSSIRSVDIVFTLSNFVDFYYSSVISHVSAQWSSPRPQLV